jgi:MGT family glycosyltransferase
MTQPSIAFFVMQGISHFQPLQPLIAAAARHGITPHVFTDRRYAAPVRAAGGTFVDLFARYPLEDADTESLPYPCRFVSFAALYADEVVRDLEEIRPALVVHDAHAVIGRVAAALLGVPYVTSHAAHNQSSARLAELLRTVAEIRISERCSSAAATLRDRYGIRDASPFSWATEISPFLNLCLEPPAFLTDQERRVLEPVAFHGCLPSREDVEARRSAAGPAYFEGAGAKLNVYVSFGTPAWRYWSAEALAAIGVLAEVFAAMPDVRAVISLGGAEIPAASVSALTKPNVSVERYVDQWRVLDEADVFVTHNGLNSTHEAIFSGVPMVSYPFTWDQPALADRCRELGFAVPLTGSLRGAVTEDEVRAAITAVSERRGSLRARLAEAREWELEVIDGRESVLRRVTELMEA